MFYHCIYIFVWSLSLLSTRSSIFLLLLVFLLSGPQFKDLPRDGKATGDVLIRGPWITSGYFKLGANTEQDNWFKTGDVASLDMDGYMQISDRSKDVIKSGGEWISSIDLENEAMSNYSFMPWSVL